MAIYHLNVKPLSRSKGHTAGNALAYECGQKLETIEGKTVDFSQKEVLRSEIIGHPGSLQALADKMELCENRKNSTLGRRFTIALPDELDRTQQWDSAQEFGKWLNKQYGVGVVVSMHAPDKGGDERNTHAHITITDRRIDEKGNFGEKARELTAAKSSKIELNRIREKWESVANIALELSGSAEEISHKSHKARGMLVQPTQHLGLIKTQQARKQKDNKPSYKITQVIENEVIKSKNERILRETSQGIRDKKNVLPTLGDRRNDEDLGRIPATNKRTEARVEPKPAREPKQKQPDRRLEEIVGSTSDLDRGTRKSKKPAIRKAKRLIAHLGSALGAFKALATGRLGQGQGVVDRTKHNNRSHSRGRKDYSSEWTKDHVRACTRGHYRGQDASAEREPKRTVSQTRGRGISR